jgi:hypothetical protein
MQATKEMNMNNSSPIVISYDDRSGAAISICKLSEPYGTGSSDVISIGVTLKNKPDAPTWKIHVPISLVEPVCRAMMAMTQDVVHVDQVTHEDLT